MDQPQSDSNIAKQNEAYVEKSLPFSYKTNGLDYFSLDGFRERELEVYINRHEPKDPGNGGNDHDPYGTHITQVAANVMVRNYWHDVIAPILTPPDSANAQDTDDTDKENVVPGNLAPGWEAILKSALTAADGHVIFSREVINWLLAQQHCEGIKFYFCKNHKGERSLALVGVDQYNSDLGATSANGSVIQTDDTKRSAVQAPAVFGPEGSAIIEVGGPNKFTSLWDAYSDMSSAYGAELREFIHSQAWTKSNGQVQDHTKGEK
ncbi:hypothetical protein GCM10010967_13040 [Dyadobacter beijingensis]|uniref:Uncharacterized protein n=1 Tax=Dyadobacter beijingensis TaxID=365489 RepID=A0ABQ2HID6_9BACT|nr:hypothetical protein [Dyadobacter beijingensis]GGM82749.1 hypothetical protein GCM10010967_13040 [Dyadobacter beijingensis]